VTIWSHVKWIETGRSIPTFVSEVCHPRSRASAGPVQFIVVETHPDDREPPQSTPRYLFSSGNTATIMGMRVPFPLSCLVSLVSFPFLIVGVLISIPWTYLHRFVTRRQEKRFAKEMSMKDRCVTWPEAVLKVESGHGTLIGEYLSSKGPFRLWWAEENLPAISPHECCFEEPPYGCEPEFGLFFRWCLLHYTSPSTGTARLVEIRDPVAQDDFAKRSVELRAIRRYVSIYPLARKRVNSS